ncbi:hypothetical protein JD844_010807, partial [Phrynosoma platyrhinos]
QRNKLLVPFLIFFAASGSVMQQQQRRERWNHEETVVFLTLFGELDVQKQLKASHRNQAIYEKLSGRMNELGFNRTASQLRTKAKDLKRQYREIKKNNGQISEDDSFWQYYTFLDDICQDENNMEPEAAVSLTSAVKKDKRHAEGQKSLPQPTDPPFSDKSQETGLPYCSSRTSQRLSDGFLGTSASGASSRKCGLPLLNLFFHLCPTGGKGCFRGSLLQLFAHPGCLFFWNARKRQHPTANARIHLAKIRARKNRSVREFSKTFLRYSKNMEKFQQSFQNYMGFESQKREKIQSEASRTRKEIRSAASQMREAILVQAEAISKVADAINRYNDLLECFVSEPDLQRGGKEVFQDDEGASKQERNSLSHRSVRRDSFSGSSHSSSSENSFD